MFSAEFIYTTMPGMNGSHCATIAKSPDGGLICAWYVYPEEETKGGRIVLARMAPGSAKWSGGTPIDLGVSSSVGNPVAFYTPDGVLWLHFIVLKGQFWNTGIWHSASSTDHGRTWTRPSVVSDVPGMMIRHTPVFLPDGRALLPTYDEAPRTTCIHESAPPYARWKEYRRFEGNEIIQPCIFESGDDMVMFIRPYGEPFNSWRSVSSDGGKTWSAPIRIPLPNPLSGVAGFCLNEKLGIVFNNSTEHKRYPLSVAYADRSMNEWSTPRAIDAASFEVSYPSFLVDDSGIVHGVYTYNRRFIKYVRFDEAWLETGS